ncbi:MAG: ATP-binding protein [Deltaproteobacteria bacterium]|nr:ATP-binding protein [Deltaproteobacteria bacterium]
MLKFKRLCSPSEASSFFLFGPRGSGKTTFLHEFFGNQKTLWFDLLDRDVEDRLSRSPNDLFAEIREGAGTVDWVVIDEVQRIPMLLDIVHRIIETSDFKPPKFALTGSSARKLKHGSANLLAGRAFVYHFHPLTHLELGKEFSLDRVLNWGSLPKVFHFQQDSDREEYLRAYGLTYLKEEVWAEHLVRDLGPFRRFVEVAAQSSGQLVNFANIGHDVGVDEKTVKSYFQILEDTLLGFILEPFSRSIRKRQLKSPKFYLFDLGVMRALERTMAQGIVPHTYAYGRAFEHFLITEIYRLNDYLRKDYRLSYLRTNDGAEIDLVVERPGATTVLIEFKSSARTDERDTSTLAAFLKDVGNAEGYCLSNDPNKRLINGIHLLPWEEGLVRLGLSTDTFK